MKYSLKLKEDSSFIANNGYSLKYRKQILLFLNKAIGLKFYKYDNKFDIKSDLDKYLYYYKNEIPENRRNLILYSIDYSNIYLINVLDDYDWTKFIFWLISNSWADGNVYFKSNCVGWIHYAGDMIGYGRTPTKMIVDFADSLEKLGPNILPLPKDPYKREWIKMRIALTYMKKMNDNIEIVLRYSKPFGDFSYMIVKKEYLQQFVSFYKPYINLKYSGLKIFVPKDNDINLVNMLASKK